MAIKFVRAMGVIQFAKEQRLAVVGPGHAAIAILEGQVGDLAAAQLFDVELVDLFAVGVEAVGQALMVGADAESAHREKTASGQYVGVEQQLLLLFIDVQRVVRRTRAAVVPCVFVALGGARVIQKRAPGRGQRQIGFENAALDLLEQGFAQGILIGQLRVQVIVLGFEVVQDLFGVSVVQPRIRVGTRVFTSDRRGGAGGG